MAEGVDVANHQRSVDWVAAKNGGIEFMYAKVTEGIQYVDPLADQHWNGARAAGLYAGLYHYARPDTNAPESDAADFARALIARGAATPGVLPPCLDIEENAGVDMVDWCLRFLNKTRELTNYGPMIVYASTSWWNNQLRSGGWLDDQTYAWVAHYGRNPGSPGWRNDRTVMHQYTSSGTIPGYNGNIDRNICWVDLALLANGTGPVSVPQPAGGGGGRAPSWPLAGQRGHFFGDINGPHASHGGYYASERPHIVAIQKALIRKGYARRNNGQPVTNPDGGWADGKFEQATIDAVARFQRAEMPGTQYFGQVWSDDWAKLLG